MKVGTCDSAEIGARMKAARTALGLTQEALAQAIDASKPGIRDNEGGKNVPGGKVIFGLVQLGINANWLLTGEGPMMLAELNSLSDKAEETERPENDTGADSRPIGALDAERLRLAITMAEDAAALIPEPLTPERRADLIMAFYERLSSKPK